ncbi:hypothetical protein L1987_18647 [Smallanthus sonchifolius]|uniref:Uncharacterized protein n=1 Tax=Smallanthus sonchifolius TaxID=185202 RepID=A0ACB9J3T2_9ASTR|nr:hypothetical protein L1987_18647 [Smallanthus sonchifolius]
MTLLQNCPITTAITATTIVVAWTREFWQNFFIVRDANHIVLQMTVRGEVEATMWDIGYRGNYLGGDIGLTPIWQYFMSQICACFSTKYFDWDIASKRLCLP